MRQASTVILVREKNSALEVYLLRRSTKSGFMGGLYVFPGGVVDPDDRGILSWAPDNMETKHGIWTTPQYALEQNLKTTIPMSPPAIVTLTQLSDFKNIDEIKLEIKNRLWGEPISP